MRIRAAARGPVTRRGVRRLADALSVLVLLFMLGQALFGLPPGHAGAQPVEPQQVPRHGAQPFLAVLCKFPDVDTNLTPRSYYEDLLFDPKDGLDTYWREVSYGNINLQGSTVTDWNLMPQPTRYYRRTSGATPADLDLLAADCTAAAEPQVDYDHFMGILLVFNRCLDRPRGGEVELSLEGERRRVGVAWLCSGQASRLAGLGTNDGQRTRTLFRVPARGRTLAAARGGGSVGVEHRVVAG